MHVDVPDPDVGRCKNVRLYRHANSEVEYLRCLDYEGTPHVCSFPTPLPRSSSSGWSSATYYTVPKPKPWVKPETTDNGRSGS